MEFLFIFVQKNNLPEWLEIWCWLMFMDKEAAYILM